MDNKGNMLGQATKNNPLTNTFSYEIHIIYIYIDIDIDIDI